MSITRNDQLWPTIDFFWYQNAPDSSHIRSFNDFLMKVPKLMTKQIPYGNFTFSMHSPKFISPNCKFEGKNVSQYPANCIYIKSSYESELTCTFSFMWKGKVIKEETGVAIGLIPAMVKSELCNLTNNKIPKDIDLPEEKQKPTTIRWKELMAMEFKTGLGGYFVKEGVPRVITFQERNKFNHPMIFDLSKNTSKTKKYNYTVEVRNSVTDTNTTGIMAVHQTKNGNIVCTMKYLDDKREIEPLLFFYALGFTDPQDIIDFIISKEDPLYKLTYVKMAIQKMFEQIEEYEKSPDQFCQETDPKECTERAIFGEEGCDATHCSKHKTKNMTCLVNGKSWMEELSSIGMKSVENKQEHVETILRSKFLHHYSTKREKAIYFGYIIYNLISISVPDEIKKENPDLKFAKEDDRDHFGSKVLNTESVLFSNVFYSAIKKQLDIMEKCIAIALKDKSDEMAEIIVREMNAKMIFPESDITKMPISTMLGKALTTNMWGITKRDGVSTIFDPINYNNAVHLLMRSCIPLKSFLGNLDPRMVHFSFWGIIDPFDTPEGETIGHNKVLSCLSFVSSEVDITPIVKYIKTETIPLSKMKENSPKYKKVFIDNQWKGVALREKCIEIHQHILSERRAGRLDATISIVWNSVKEELHIYSQEGRLLRPYLIVENGEILLKKDDWKNYKTWQDLCGSGKIEMLDCNEFEYVKLYCVQVNDFMKLNKKKRLEYSHVDVHPATLFGACAGALAYPNMTQGPRNSYGANQFRQSIATTTRFDTPRILFYPQRALVRNKIASMLLHYDEYPAGMNVQVALMPALGFEQEDGYIINRRFIEMGGFMTGKKIKHVIVIEGDDKKIEIPKENECFKFKPKDLQNIDENGIIRKGSPVYMNDPLYCMTIAENNGTFKKTDATFFHTEENMCWVEDVMVRDKGFRNSKIIKITLAETRLCKYGNKFAPREAQKGTSTYLCPHEDMPFDPVTNTTVTICVNPLCLPSRMTVNYLYEILFGEYVCYQDKLSIEQGKKGVYNHPGFENCTPYDEDPVEQYERVTQDLKRMGFRQDGCKQLIDGRTGEMIAVPIFCGHVHMQTLKHMADDKIAKRATGAISARMRCPTEGRSKGGGPKTGTMEKDVLAAGDAPEILLDRMCLSSDKFETTVCKHCGVIESHSKNIKARCKACRKDDAMVSVTMSYSPKVVFQELMGMCVIPRLLVAPKEDVDRKTKEYLKDECEKINRKTKEYLIDEREKINKQINPNLSVSRATIEKNLFG